MGGGQRPPVAVPVEETGDGGGELPGMGLETGTGRVFDRSEENGVLAMNQACASRCWERSSTSVPGGAGGRAINLLT